MTSLRFTEFCETQWRHSVKTRLYKNPPPYFIVLASSVKTKEVEVIEFHRIRKSTILFYTLQEKRRIADKPWGIEIIKKGIFAEFAVAKNVK